MVYLDDVSLAYYDFNSQYGETIVNTVEVAKTYFARSRGRMFTNTISTDYALVFPFTRTTTVPLHMLFVPYELGVLWVENTEITDRSVLPSWYGTGTGVGNAVIELAPKHISTIPDNAVIYLQGTTEYEQLQKPNDIPDTNWS